jgi:hypothetical protein
VFGVTSESNAVLLVNTGDGERRVTLGAYLEPLAMERAERDANQWIKSLRALEIDGVPLRDRFLFRGDSLWWFAELYLHKRRVVVSIFRTLAALESLVARECPLALGVVEGNAIVAHLAQKVAEKRQLTWRGGPKQSKPTLGRRLEPFLKGTVYTAAALLNRIRPGRRHPQLRGPVKVAAFVHSAFWRPATDDESYIGPVLDEVTRLVGREELALVGLGPRVNFRSRTWSQRVAGFFRKAEPLPFDPVSGYATAAAVAPSNRVWAERSANRGALLGATTLQQACVFRGCDGWPLMRDEFTGVSHLQFPWSARIMDEVGAALDALKPRVAITYAEAGGSGRALVLEARRRNIPVAGLQHGFIYRHWLNYLHEADEMVPSPGNPADRGFPRPDLTLLYDQFAALHLMTAGHFPPEALAVSGSAKLDAFVRSAGEMDDGALEALRASVGAEPGQRLVVLATKYSQVAVAFDELIHAVAGMPDVRLVVKCHPAETGAPYARAAAGAANVTIAPASADLARLIAASSVLVTVNSTAAIEAMPLDVPALVVALPNNLSPFVDAGAVAGAGRGEIGQKLRDVLYDKEFRDRLAQGRRTFMARYQIVADGRAATRAADAIVRLALA